MSSMPYLKQHANGTWYIHWTENRVGKRESTGLKDEAEARRTYAEWILDRESEHAETRGAHLTLADVWKHYFEKHVAVKSADTYGAELAWKQMKPYFGDLPATGLTQDAADDYVRRRTSGKLGRKVKPQTVAKELTYLRAAVAFCADPRRKVIAPECSHKLTLPEQGPRRDRWLRPNEVQQLLAGARSFYGDGRLGRGERFIWLALETAGREQALLDLTWDRVDFQTNTIQLDAPHRRKTKKRRAAVPISKALRPILERAYRERIGDRVLDNGGAIWPTIQSIVIHAGLAPKQEIATSKKPKATGISPHVFRHTSATAMVRKRVPIPLVAQILGNSVKMVTDVYGHWAKEDLQDAVDVISG